jgi:hypothetical protein
VAMHFCKKIIHPEILINSFLITLALFVMVINAVPYFFPVQQEQYPCKIIESRCIKPVDYEYQKMIKKQEKNMHPILEIYPRIIYDEYDEYEEDKIKCYKYRYEEVDRTCSRFKTPKDEERNWNNTILILEMIPLCWIISHILSFFYVNVKD